MRILIKRKLLCWQRKSAETGTAFFVVVSGDREALCAHGEHVLVSSKIRRWLSQDTYTVYVCGQK